MDTNVRNAIAEYEDYQRLKKVFPLDFVVDCLSNPRRGTNGIARWVGKLLGERGTDPTLFVSGVHYHELVELEELRKMGYSDERLGENHSQDPNLKPADTIAKRKELEYYQTIADKVAGVRPPFLSWVFTHLSVVGDYGMSVPPFDVVCRMIEERGAQFYKHPFAIKDVGDGISLLKLGGEVCSEEQQAMHLAQTYLSGRRPAPKVEPWMLV